MVDGKTNGNRILTDFTSSHQKRRLLAHQDTEKSKTDYEISEIRGGWGPKNCQKSSDIIYG